MGARWRWWAMALALGWALTGSALLAAGFVPVASNRIGPSGGTVTYRGITVTVPAGALARPARVILTAAPVKELAGDMPRGQRPVAAFGLLVEDALGKRVTPLVADFVLQAQGLAAGRLYAYDPVTTGLTLLRTRDTMDTLVADHLVPGSWWVITAPAGRATLGYGGRVLAPMVPSRMATTGPDETPWLVGGALLLGVGLAIAARRPRS